MPPQKLVVIFCLVCLYGFSFVFYKSFLKEIQNEVNYFNISRAFELFSIPSKSCIGNPPGCKAFDCLEFRNLISDWQNVSHDGSVFVYSSFYDEDEITVLGAALVRNVSVFCQIYGRTGGLTIRMSTVKATIRYLPDHNYQRYRPCFFLCSSCGFSTDLAVSLVINDSCSVPLHVLPVLSRPRSRIDDMARKFTVCVAPLHLKAPHSNQLVEWIELNRILGAEYFVFYNYSIDSNDSRVLQYYSHKGIAEVHPWSLMMTGKIHYYGQMTAINDCIFRHKNNTEFLAIFDLDEFIIPRWGNDRTWNEMLERLPRASSYIFRTVVFPKQIKVDGKSSRKINKIHYNFITMEKTKRIPKIWPAKKRSKAIHNPRNIDVGGIHFAWSFTRGDAVVVNTSIGLVHHYRSWSFDSTESDTRTLWYKTELTERVDRTWKDLNNTTFSFSTAYSTTNG